jgi:hypothetical protein
VVIEGRPKACLVRTPSQSPGTDLCSTKSIFCALSADCALCAIVTKGPHGKRILGARDLHTAKTPGGLADEVLPFRVFSPQIRWMSLWASRQVTNPLQDIAARFSDCLVLGRRITDWDSAKISYET